MWIAVTGFEQDCCSAVQCSAVQCSAVVGKIERVQVEEAGRTAADVEAKMRQRDRKGGFNKMDEIDEQEVEEYYRNRWVEEGLVVKMH